MIQKQTHQAHIVDVGTNALMAAVTRLYQRGDITDEQYAQSVQRFERRELTGRQTTLNGIPLCV